MKSQRLAPILVAVIGVKTFNSSSNAEVARRDLFGAQIACTSAESQAEDTKEICKLCQRFADVEAGLEKVLIGECTGEDKELLKPYPFYKPLIPKIAKP